MSYRDSGYLNDEQRNFKVGDIVSRNGDDEQVILSIDSEWFMMDVKCIKSGAWNKAGDIEPNLVHRYRLVRSNKAAA